MFWRTLLFLKFASVVSATAAGPTSTVVEYLPADYVRDGSVSYHAEIQQAIDAADGTLVFPAMTYAVDETGWTLHSGLTLEMHGAVFSLSDDCDSDGAIFRGESVSDITMTGGTFAGRNDVWADGVNIRGIHITGKSAQLRFQQMQFRDLSSNGIGLFGTQEAPIRDVWVRDVIVENCCKRYPDYLSGEKPEQGSEREDQGDVAFYFVEDFVVDGCRFERSRSDGTHFYRCRRGQITDNRISRAKMGGYFLETCELIVGRGNIMLENGSRGTTIERGSTNCVFTGNMVSLSGREGLWAPDCVGLSVTGNIFDRNGRKPNGSERRYIWNANITINEATKDPSNSPTEDYLISDNIITTTTDQVAAIRIDTASATRGIVIRDNLLLGENRDVLVEGPHPDVVTQSGNVSREPESSPNEPTVLFNPDVPVPASADCLPLEGVEFHVIQPRQPDVDGYNWLHGVALAFDGDDLIATFGHNRGDENTAGEIVNGRRSTDGGRTWGPLFSLAKPSQPGEAVSHGALLRHNGTMWAFQGAFTGRLQDVHTQAFTLDPGSDSWRSRGVICRDGFFPMQQPLPMDDGNWIMAGLQVQEGIGKPDDPAAVAISHGDDFTAWDVVPIPRPADLDMWGEATVIVDGAKVLCISRWRRPIALVSTSEDYGRTWTPIAASNLPMTASKPYAGTLSTGQRFLIGTTTADAGNRRSPLTIAVSRPDESVFSRVFRIRDAVHGGPGESHPQAKLSYPCAIERDGRLYVGYSNDGGRGKNLNSAELAIIPVPSLVVP